MGGAENSFGNWNDFLPMVAGWVFLVMTFVFVVAFIAYFTQKVMGWGGEHVDD